MERDYLERCVSKGMSQYKIAKDAGCSQTNVKYWLRKHGLATVWPRHPVKLGEGPKRIAPMGTLPLPPAFSLLRRKGGKSDSLALGANTESRVLAALINAGYPCYLPFAIGRCDLIFETEDGPKTVQCKTGRIDSKGSFSFRTCSTLNQGAKSGTRPGYQGVVDYFGVSCPEVPGVFLLLASELPEGTASLRFAASGNGQLKNTRWAEDFLVPGSDKL
jgi:hypothetical protein